MRVFLAFIILTLAAGCTGGSGGDKPEKAAPDAVPATRRVQAADSIRMPVGWSRIWSEVAYYLERHTEQDDGYDLVARYAEQGDSALAVYEPQASLHLFNVGRWRGLSRESTGLTHDAVGRVVVGLFEDDSLVSGLRIDTAGVYGGRLTRNAEAAGYGVYQLFSGAFYEGQWQRDCRNGYGLGISPHFLHAGWWRNDRFVGERMRHTADRIYGIDVSRYQHERNRRRYAIDWRRLRITSLGHRISSHRVSGSVDYPVTFAYIKSTEGISIKNRYFLGDYAAARDAHIVVGAYHFFSTRQSALAQASFFLHNSCFRRGDLPPMLDLEPSDAQIAAMGGPESLFREVRQWLRRVEERLGVRPIIYANQRFVNMYMKDTPDLKQNYQVWIARYGEYKPYAHAAFWQLSADGRVRGIQGEVDINVFNGYQNHWDDYLRLETIR